MDFLTPEQRSKLMSAIRSTNTKDEVRLAKALWALGYRYRRNNKTVFGRPDFTFKKIERNMQRDIEVNTYLESQNWKILRFWSNDIKKNLDLCILEIENAIKERQKPLI